MNIILTSISIGLLATTSPCILPLYPGFLAYLAGQNTRGKGATILHPYLGFFVLGGVLTMMLALGAIIAALSVSVGRALSIVIPFADSIIILLGFLLLFNLNPFKSLP